MKLESLELSRKADDTEGIAYSLSSLGYCHLGAGDPAQAQPFFEESLAHYRRLQDQHGIAGMLHRIGWTLHLRGEEERVEALFTEGYGILSELQDRWSLGNLLRDWARVCWEQGNLTRAQRFAEESQTLFRDMGNRKMVRNLFSILSYLAMDQGDLTAARMYEEQHYALFQELADTANKDYDPMLRGLIAFHAADLETARTLLRASLSRKWWQNPLDLRTRLLLYITPSIALGRANHAARLLGADTEQCRINAMPRPPFWQAQYDRIAAAARAALGEAAFQSAWEEGAVMSVEQIVACLHEMLD
jgi:hypothetical protein